MYLHGNALYSCFNLGKCRFKFKRIHVSVINNAKYLHLLNVCTPIYNYNVTNFVGTETDNEKINGFISILHKHNDDIFSIPLYCRF